MESFGRFPLQTYSTPDSLDLKGMIEIFNIFQVLGVPSLTLPQNMFGLTA